eukprot:PhF_6_TR27305/c0_g1_i1/m.40092
MAEASLFEVANELERGINDWNNNVDKTVRKLAVLSILKRKQLHLRQILVGFTLAALLPATFSLHTFAVSGSYETFLATILTTILILQQACIWWLYKVKLLRKLALGEVDQYNSYSVISSTYGLPYVRHAIVSFLHCPPGLRMAWPNGVYLNSFVFLQLLYAFPFMKDYSPLNTFASKVLSRLGRVPFNTSFILKAYLQLSPVRFVVFMYLLIWIVCSLFLVTAEDYNFGEATWFMFVTSTTVGYGDKTPKSFFGRFVSCVMVLSGITCTSILTAIVMNKISLSERQRNVVHVLHAHERRNALLNHAVLTLQSAWRYHRNYRQNSETRNNSYDLFRINEMNRRMINAAKSMRKSRLHVIESYGDEDAAYNLLSPQSRDAHEKKIKSKSKLSTLEESLRTTYDGFAKRVDTMEEMLQTIIRERKELEVRLQRKQEEASIVGVAEWTVFEAQTAKRRKERLVGIKQQCFRFGDNDDSQLFYE